MSGQNRTEIIRDTRTPKPQYPFVRRPQVIRMRDLSPASRARVATEYYQTYDVMTGVRIAATLGGLITLFALFLFYKSRCKPERPIPRIDLDEIISRTYSDTSSSSSSSSDTSTPIPAEHGGFAPPPTPILVEPEKLRKNTLSATLSGSSTSREIPSTSQISSELVRPSSGHGIKTKIIRNGSSRQSNYSIASGSSSSPTSAKSSCSSPDAIVFDRDSLASSSSVIVGRTSGSIPPFVPHMVVVKCHGDKIVVSR